MTKDQIKILLDFLRQHGGKYEVNYLKWDHIKTAEDCYNIYYGGSRKIGISYYKERDTYFVSGVDSRLILREEEAINSIEEVFKDNIQDEFHQAMKNLGWGDEYEVLKYFEDDTESHNRLKDEIKRLLNTK